MSTDFDGAMNWVDLAKAAAANGAAYQEMASVVGGEAERGSIESRGLIWTAALRKGIDPRWYVNA